MDLNKKEILTKAGIDVESLSERLMGNDKLIEKFLKKFADDSNFAALTEAAEKGDTDSMITASHTLKGMCGNLSMTNLYNMFSQQVELLRSGESEKAAEMMEKITEEYKKITDALAECWQ